MCEIVLNYITLHQFSKNIARFCGSVYDEVWIVSLFQHFPQSPVWFYNSFYDFLLPSATRHIFSVFLHIYNAYAPQHGQVRFYEPGHFTAFCPSESQYLTTLQSAPRHDHLLVPSKTPPQKRRKNSSLPKETTTQEGQAHFLELQIK